MIDRWRFHNWFCVWLLRKFRGRWAWIRPRWVQALNKNNTRNLYRCQICGIHFVASMKRTLRGSVAGGRYYIYTPWRKHEGKSQEK